MAISRGKLSNTLESITMTFPDTTDTLTLWFKPDVFTPEMQEAHNRIQRRLQQRTAQRKRVLDAGGQVADDDDLDEAEMGPALDMILKMVARWDMLEFDPTDECPSPPVLPIDKPTIKSLGWRTINRIIREMVATISADPTKSVSIVGGSERMADRDLSRSGSFS